MRFRNPRPIRAEVSMKQSYTNSRRAFDTQGVLVPLIVRDLDLDRFEVVAGARRFRAARLAELASVPVRVVQLTDTQVLEYQLIENAIREDVHPYEEAMAYKTLLETSEPRYDVASIAAKTGSITHVYQRLRLGQLIPDAAEVFQTNQITAGHAVLIARLPQEQQKDALAATFLRTGGPRRSTPFPFVSWRSGFARTSCSRWPTPFSIAKTRSSFPPLDRASRARNAPEPIRRSSMISPRTTVVWTRRASGPKSMRTSPARSSTPTG